MITPKALALVAGMAIAFPGAGKASDVVIGVPSWSSGEVTAHVLKRIIEDNFDVQVGLQTGSSDEIFARMDEGTAHVHPEVWFPNHEAQSTEYVVRRRTVLMSPRGVPARQGLCVTRHTMEHYGISEIADLTDPEKARIFDTAGDGRGEVWIGAPDWTSTRIERIRARSYGYAETMELLEADEIMATAAIDAAVAVDKPLVFYCYEPHHVFELHDIVHLSEPRHDPRNWRIVDPSLDDDWLDSSSADVAWPVSFLHIHYSTRLADEHPDIANLLGAVSLDVDTVSRMSYAVVVERRDPADFAADWIAENAGRIAAWLEAGR